ncbi:hypothetical protein EV424DRAFT_1343377 [Suillus variegatus]|nr:hypothetical protein EV424DRAFT_1343377 [Suillus variegatus]
MPAASTARGTRGQRTRSVTRDYPVVRQPGLNITGNQSRDQVGSTAERPPSIINDMEFSYNSPPPQHAPLQHTPLQHLPPQHAPLQHAPLQHLPPQHAPLQHAPLQHLPPQHAPLQHAPLQHAPLQHLLPQHLPPQHLPPQHMPSQHPQQSHPDYYMRPPGTTIIPPSYRGVINSPQRHRDPSRFEVAYALAPMRFRDDVPGLFTEGVVLAVGDNSTVERTQTRHFILPTLAPPRGVASTSSNSNLQPAPAPASTSSASILQPQPAPASTSSASILQPQPAPASTSSAPILLPTPASAPPGTSAISSSLLTVPPSLAPLDSNLPYNPKNNAHKEIANMAKKNLTGKSETSKLWTSNNATAMYKTVAAPVSTILSVFGTVAQGLVQVLYDLRPSIWSSVSELQHKTVMVERLTDEETLEFIFGQVQKLPNGQDIRYPFEPHSTVTYTRIRRTAEGDNVAIEAGQPMWAHGNNCTMVDEWAAGLCVPVANGWAGGI